MKSRPLFLTFLLAACFLVLSLGTAHAQGHVPMKMIPPGCSHNTEFPDLIVVSGTITKADQFVAQIKNQGPCPAGACRLGIYVYSHDGPVHPSDLFKSVNIPALAPGQTYTAHASAGRNEWRYVTKEKLTLEFVIDDKDQVPEGNEYNNRLKLNP